MAIKMPDRSDYAVVAKEPEKSTETTDIEPLKAADEGEDVDLPEDVYGAVMYSVINDTIEILSEQDRDRLDRSINITRVAFIVTSVVFNYVLQLSLLVWSFHAVVAPAVLAVQKIYKAYHAECFNRDGTYDGDACDSWPEGQHNELCGMVLSSFWFLYLILCLWWMTMLSEFRKTDRIWRKIHGMKIAAGDDAQIVVDEFGIRRLKRIARPVKWFLFIVLVLPKHIISVVLLVLGTWWLVATASFADLILNALALGFVIEIDELIFEATFPISMTDELSRVKLWRPRRHSHAAEQKAQCRGYARSAVYWAVLLGGVYMYLSKLQCVPFLGVLPGYNNDIATHCVRYWKEETEMICSSWAVFKGNNCFPFGISHD